MTYKVYLTNGSSFEVELVDYDANRTATSLNDTKTIYISIGGAIMNKNVLSHIVPSV